MSIDLNTSDSLAFSAEGAAELVEPHLRRFSVSDYHQMIEAGVLTENDRVQLVNGWIIEIPPIGPLHGASTTLTNEVIRQQLPKGWHLRVQQPITLASGEPEPDIAVVRGHARDYAKRHPTATDTALVVEIADHTLKFDRTEKAHQYAAAEIAEYWIVNLIDRKLEVRRQPQATASGAEYRSREVVDAGGAVDLTLAAGQVARIAVSDLLP